MKIKPNSYKDKVLLAIWREIVLIRDGHKCQVCGTQSRKLEVHHIFGRGFHSLRYDPDNGITLCFKHHKYGKHAAHEAPEWFREFLIKRMGEDAYELLYYKSRMISKPDYNMLKMCLTKVLVELKEK